MAHQATIFGPAVAEWTESGTLLPADDLTAHDQRRAVAIQQALLVEHVDGVLWVVENDDVLPQGADMNDPTYQN